MNNAEVQQLRERFEIWLDEHFEPKTTQAGRPKTRGGVTIYQEPRRVEFLLGESIRGAVMEFRRGNRPPYRVLLAIQEVVEAWSIDEIRRLRRDQKLARALESALRFEERHGVAPDGGGLESWARSKLETLNERYGTEGLPDGEPLELWYRCVGRPEANQVRRVGAA